MFKVISRIDLWLLCSLFPTVALSAEFIPEYEGGELFIPVIDMPSGLGRYQNVIFEYTGDNNWQITGANDGSYRNFDEFETIVVDDAFPVQVFVNIRGEGSGCIRVGPVRYAITGNVIELFVYRLIPREPTTCGAAVVPYSEYFSLPVYGMDAGEYEYIINGEFSDTFMLNADNHF